MNEVWDAVVVGAGPAGSLVARQLAQSGRRVLLVDRVDKDDTGVSRGDRLKASDRPPCFR